MELKMRTLATQLAVLLTAGFVAITMATCDPAAGVLEVFRYYDGWDSLFDIFVDEYYYEDDCCDYTFDEWFLFD